MNINSLIPTQDGMEKKCQLEEIMEKLLINLDLKLNPMIFIKFNLNSQLSIPQMDQNLIQKFYFMQQQNQDLNLLQVFLYKKILIMKFKKINF